jgi:hypothetical protein
MNCYGDEWSASRPGRFTPREEFCYLLDRKQDGSQCRSEGGDEEKNTPNLSGLELRSRLQPVGLITVLTELYRLILLVTKGLFVALLDLYFDSPLYYDLILNY